MIYVNFGTSGREVTRRVGDLAQELGVYANHWSPGPTWCVRAMSREPLVAVLVAAGFTAEEAAAKVSKAEEQAHRFGYIAEPV